MNEWRQRQGRGHESWLRNVSVLLSHCETLTRLLFFYFLTRLLHSNVSGYFLNGLLARGPVPKSFYLYPLIITLSPSHVLFLLSSKTWPVIAVRKAQRRRLANKRTFSLLGLNMIFLPLTGYGLPWEKYNRGVSRRVLTNKRLLYVGQHKISKPAYYASHETKRHKYGWEK